MTTSAMVLVVTNKTDVTADLVILEFQRRGTPYARFNTEDFPQRVQISWLLGTRGIEGHIFLPHTDVPLDQVTSVWYRRPLPPNIAEIVRYPFREFAHRESQEALSGLWRTMKCFWMSYPDAIAAASYKIRQLSVAHSLGFNVPSTLISNAPELVDNFRRDCGQIVAKPLFSGEVQSERERRVVFTTPIRDSDSLAFSNIQLAPAIFQAYVHKDLELRVTVIGDKVFTASINSQEVDDALNDWRRAAPGSLCFQSYTLPQSVSEQCAQMIATLGLSFGTIDMVKTPDGNYVFLELNPNGQWGWLESHTGDPYTATIATLLEQGRGEVFS